MDKKVLIIFIILILVVVAGIYYFGFGGKKEITEKKGELVSPLEKMPSVNPFDKVINPFRDLYKNPFK
jgi:flagellar basal body-associated protein FliL